MRKHIVWVLLLIISWHSKTVVQSDDFSEKNLIYEQITKNNPKLDKEYALKLSKIILKVSKTHKINPKKYAAILAQESMYNLEAVNLNRGMTKDLGISQINIKTAKAYNFNIEKLTTDLNYSVAAGAKVLADLKNSYAHKEDEWWTRYNSSNKLKRKVYLNSVIRYL